MIATLAACDAGPTDLADLEAPGEPGAHGKADGFESDLIEALTEKYGLRPRRYLGFWDDSNEAERRFLDHLPGLVDELNLIAERRGQEFRFTEAELAINFITEGGFYLLDEDFTDSDFENEIYIDGYSYLGVDTFVDRIEDLDPWLTTEIYFYIVNSIENELPIAFEVENELGQTVTSIVVQTIEQGIEANATMFAWSRELAAADFAARNHDFTAMPAEGQFYWTTVYYNAGPGFGRKRLQSEGPDYWKKKWTGGDDPAVHNRYARYNASWRTASLEFLDKMKYR